MKREKIFDQKNMDAFADALKSARAKKGETQESLSYKTGIALSQIARIETGAGNPTLSTVFALAKGLKIPLPELFDFKLRH